MRDTAHVASTGVKRSLLTEGHGVPIGLTIEGAQRHDMKLVRPTIESIVVDRPQPTKVHPQGMCLDKGYDYDEVRGILSEFGFTAHIRARGEEAKAIKREAGFKARSWVVENTQSPCPSDTSVDSTLTTPYAWYQWEAPLAYLG